MNQDIKQLVEEGRLQEALSYCEQALMAQPQSDQLHNDKAKILIQLQRPDEAVDVYSQLFDKYLKSNNHLLALNTAKKVEALNSLQGQSLQKKLAHAYKGGAPRSKQSTYPSLRPAYSPEDDPLIQQLMQEAEMADSLGDAGDKTIVGPLPVNLKEMMAAAQAAEAAQAEAAAAAEAEEPPPAEEFEPTLPSLFDELDADSTTAIFSKMEQVSFQPGETIIQQGEKGDHFYLIGSGSVEVTQRVEDEDEVVGELQESQFFGEIALLTPLLRTASIKANTECELLRLSRHDLKEIVINHPQVHQELRKFIYQRLIQNLLSNSLLFFALPEEKRWELAEQFSVLEAQQEQLLLTEGIFADGLYLIAAGGVDIHKKKPDGSSAFVTRLEPGHFFGELSLLSQSPSTISIVACEATTLLRLNAEDFQNVMSQYPRAFDILKAVAEQRSQELTALDDLWREVTTHQPPVL